MTAVDYFESITYRMWYSVSLRIRMFLPSALTILMWAYNGGRYLIGRGYSKIALLIGEQKFLSTQLRIEGFEKAMYGTGAQYHIFTGIDTVEKAYHKSKEVLEEYDIQAFFVSGDERALGVYRGIYEKGMRIPEDVAVLGIDNITLGEFYYPPIHCRSGFQTACKMLY